MEVITTTRAANTGSERAGFNNSGTIINHYPIYGKIRPDCKICFIYIGLQDYEKAEVVNRLNRHIAAVIMLPDTRPC